MNAPPVFSVITPTYNRKHTLPKVYDALARQTFTDFEWIIVDDGSTDGTADLVAGWDAPFPIVYRSKKNGGRPSAVNLGMADCRGRFMVVLDSDDLPVPEALATFAEVLSEAPEDVCAAGGLTLTAGGEVIGSRLRAQMVDMTHLDAYARFGMTGDKWFAFKTDVARRFPYSVYAEEKHSPEGLVFNRMSREGYRTRFIDRPLMVHEYMEDGLTQNILKVKAGSPMGFLAFFAETLSGADARLSSYYFKSAANTYAIMLLNSRRPFVTAALMALALPVGIVKGMLDRFRLRRSPGSPGTR